MTSSAPRYLIVNADDFGCSALTNTGIIEAHEFGIVTSTSLMVRYQASREAPQYSAKYPHLNFGLHIDLGEWVCQNDEWIAAYEVCDLNNLDEIRKEVRRQLGLFQRIMGRIPTHLDSHQHVHRDKPAKTAVVELGTELGIPVRHFIDDIQYSGQFYGQSGKGHPCHECISTASLIEAIIDLPAGITEMGCHPGRDSRLHSTYCYERIAELTALCSPLVRKAMTTHNIILRGYHNPILLQPDLAGECASSFPECIV